VILVRHAESQGNVDATTYSSTPDYEVALSARGWEQAVACGAGVLCCAVLCCAVLCCAVLCCAVLCCAVLCCAVLCCAVLCCAALRCAAVRCAVLCCAALRCAVLRCAALRCAWHGACLAMHCWTTGVHWPCV
jgi:hypothetical protein